MLSLISIREGQLERLRDEILTDIATVVSGQGGQKKIIVNTWASDDHVCGLVTVTGVDAPSEDARVMTFGFDEESDMGRDNICTEGLLDILRAVEGV
jgi:hypothetical protein